jgi:hypothetical protein
MDRHRVILLLPKLPRPQAFAKPYRPGRELVGWLVNSLLVFVVEPKLGEFSDKLEGRLLTHVPKESVENGRGKCLAHDLILSKWNPP